MRIITEVLDIKVDEADTLYAATIASAAIVAGVTNSESKEEAERLIKRIEQELEKQKARIEAVYFTPDDTYKNVPIIIKGPYIYRWPR